MAFNSSNEPVIPSMITNGEDFPLTEISPRIFISAPSLPGRVEVRVIVNPGTSPCKATVALAITNHYYFIQHLGILFHNNLNARFP